MKKQLNILILMLFMGSGGVLADGAKYNSKLAKFMIVSGEIVGTSKFCKLENAKIAMVESKAMRYVDLYNASFEDKNLGISLFKDVVKNKETSGPDISKTSCSEFAIILDKVVYEIQKENMASKEKQIPYIDKDNYERWLKSGEPAPIFKK